MARFRTRPVLLTVLLSGTAAILLCVCFATKDRITHLLQRYINDGEPDWRAYPPLAMQAQRGVPDLTMEPWYGNASAVGTSPYDFIPRPLRPGERKFRLLVLSDFPDYLERMNSHTYEIVEAAKRHPRVQVDVWGKGWAGWDTKLKLSENLAARVLPGTAEPVGCGYYDAYFTLSNFPRPHWDWVDNAGCGTIHVHQFGDCHSDECIDQMFPVQGNITLTKYAFEHLDMLPYERLRDRFPDFRMQLFSHSPDAANPWDYFPLPRWSQKTRGAVLFGAAHSLYIMRPRIEHAINHNRTFITKFSHPGFYIHRAKIPKKKLATYVPGHPSYKPQVKRREQFAEGMRHAQICVFDSSIEKKAIRKYAQAFLSGCVVAGDIPTEQEAVFRNFMIVLRPNAPISEINRIIYDALMDPVELQNKALAAFAYAREFLTDMRKLDRLISDVEAYKRGKRGYSFSNPFSLSCRRYWNFAVPWCEGDRKPTYKAPRSIA